MKRNLLYPLFAIAILTGCSSAYRTSQTPDDVYYSPAKKIIAADQDQYESYASSSDDEYLRMKVRDHERWSAIDDYDYWNDSRYYSNNYYNPYTSFISLGVGFGGYPYYTSYNPYWYNSWYSPYYTVVYYKNPKVYYQSANRYNVAGYNNRNYNNYNLPLQNSNRSNTYNNSNTNANRTRNTNYYQQPNQNNDSRPVRTFNNSSSSGSVGGGARTSGGGTGTRTRP